MANPWWGAQEKDKVGKETVLLKHVYKEERIKDVAFKANCRAMQHTHLNQSQFFPLKKAHKKKRSQFNAPKMPPQ